MNIVNGISKWGAVVGFGALLLATPTAWAQSPYTPALHAGKVDAGKQGTNNWDYTAANGGVSKELLAQVGVDQKMDAQIPLDLQFKDEDGKAVRLGEYFGRHPVMVTMLQMTCDQVCSAQIEAMTRTMNDMSFSAGKEFEVLNVSIDPREGPLVAQDAKEDWLKNYHRPTAKAGWHFLTGDQKNIHALAAALGIRYIWHEPTKQYIHPDGIVVATPDGKTSRYFLSFADYNQQYFKFAIMEASKERVGSVVDNIALSCFHYNPNTGKYSFQIMEFLRIVGAAFVVGTLLAILGMVAMERRRGGKSKLGGGPPRLKKA